MIYSHSFVFVCGVACHEVKMDHMLEYIQLHRSDLLLLFPELSRVPIAIGLNNLTSFGLTSISSYAGWEENRSDLPTCSDSTTIVLVPVLLYFC
jgi:hypothetical protein